MKNVFKQTEYRIIGSPPVLGVGDFTGSSSTRATDFEKWDSSVMGARFACTEKDGFESRCFHICF